VETQNFRVSTDGEESTGENGALDDRAVYDLATFCQRRSRELLG
jgi:hypothetical protein